MKMRLIAGALAGLGLSLAATSVSATSYSISYTGVQDPSTIPGITAGENYQLTLVFDNGGSTPNGQTWTGANIQCVIWKFNNAQNIIYTQDTATNALSSTTGTATTNGAGILQTNYTNVQDVSAGSAGTTLTGAAFAVTRWYANNINNIFFSGGDITGDAAWGVQMAAAGWSNPVPFVGNCAGRILPVPLPAAATVPTMSEWTMILLGSLLAGGAALMIQRRRLAA